MPERVGLGHPQMSNIYITHAQQYNIRTMQQIRGYLAGKQDEQLAQLQRLGSGVAGS